MRVYQFDGPIKGSTTSDAKVSFPGLEEEVVPHDWHLRAFELWLISSVRGEAASGFVHD